MPLLAPFMALHPSFPASPYDPLLPDHRWFPADEALRASSYEKLLPPLVAKIRAEVQAWRDDFQLTLHIQDEVRVMRPTGNLFLIAHLDSAGRADWRSVVAFFARQLLKELRLVGGFELKFARFLEDASDVRSFAKNYSAVGFRLDYVKADGDLSTCTPDFIVRDAEATVWILETKGREELDIPRKTARLKQWCEDATAAETEEGGSGIRYDFLYVDQDGFEKHGPRTVADLAASFTEYKS